MLTHEENELLCRVEGEAAMGQLMRRHWIPACLIEEVAEPDCTPKKVRLLGEDLVVFRDSDGRLGVLDERCPHRRASLALGRNEECGLRCLYHGWKIDVEGNVLEMASEPPESGLVQKVKMKAYPVREAGGFVWTYLGPAETMREFEAPAFAPTADTNVSIVKIHVDCNWAQVLEGQIDSAHSSSLHSSDITPARVDSAKNAGTHWLRPSTDKAPRLQVERTSYGFHYAAIRRPIANSATHDYVRKTVYIAAVRLSHSAQQLLQCHQRHRPRRRYAHGVLFYCLARNRRDRSGGLAQIQRRAAGHRSHSAISVICEPAVNGYLQDRNAMKLGDFTGIRGIPNQDISMWETMGAIADRTKERLGASDLAVAEFRQLMVDAAREMQKGGPALGRTEPHIPHVNISSYERVLPKSVDWRTFGATEERASSEPAREQVA